MSLITLNHVFKSFKDGDNTFNVLEDIQLEIKAQSVTSLIGVSGSGKTTLLNILTQLERPSQGEVISKDNLNIGYITQSAHFIDELSIEQNLIFASLKTQNTLKIKEYSEYFSCAHLLKKKPRHLSGGERQRINIIRALILEPEVLILDEPTASLDSDNKIKVISLLNQINEQHHTAIILVTHDKDILKTLHNNTTYEIKDRKITLI